jgi:hypothetical protein
MEIINKKRGFIIIFLLVTLFITINTSVNAVVIDGSINENEWNFWFTDDSEEPILNVYWYIDQNNFNLGILTNKLKLDEDLLEFAFRAIDVDYWIKYKPGISTVYKKSRDDTALEWWEDRTYNGLPRGVNITTGVTNGTRSYEISITLDRLNQNPEDLPERFTFWYKVQHNAPNGPDNFYPNTRAGWWFDILREHERDEKIPTFHVPELPIGTLLALMAMIASYIALSKKRVQYSC